MTKTTNYVWDSVNDSVLSELDGTNTVTATYTNEPQQYGSVISQRRGTTSHTLHADALGTTRLLTTSAQASSDTYLYDAWGNLITSTGTTVNPFRWVGRYGYYQDSSTGLVYVRARMYQPTAAMWLSIDPILWILFITRLNGVGTYVYCNDRPVASIDPTAWLSSSLTAIVVPGIDSETCEEAWKQVQEEMAKWEVIIRKKGCGAPEFECGDCKGKGGSVVYNQNTKKIRVCIDSCNKAKYNKEELVLALKHEYVHAFDHCKNDKRWECDTLGCSEIRGYSFNCVVGTRWRGKMSYEDCIKKYATQSLELWVKSEKTPPPCKGKEAATIDRLMEKCMVKEGDINAGVVPFPI